MAFWSIQEVRGERPTSFASFWYNVFLNAKGRLHNLFILFSYVCIIYAVH